MCKNVFKTDPTSTDLNYLTFNETLLQNHALAQIKRRHFRITFVVKHREAKLKNQTLYNEIHPIDLFRR